MNQQAYPGVSLRGGRLGFSPSTRALSPAYILEICIGVVWKTYEIPTYFALTPPAAKNVNETPAYHMIAFFQSSSFEDNAEILPFVSQ